MLIKDCFPPVVSLLSKINGLVYIAMQYNYLFYIIIFVFYVNMYVVDKPYKIRREIVNSAKLISN